MRRSGRSRYSSFDSRDRLTEEVNGTGTTVEYTLVVVSRTGVQVTGHG